MTTATLATPIVADPTILTRLTVDWLVDHSADAERISKAHDIVSAGGVERTSTPHLFLVVSQSKASAAYHVDDRTGCHCPDAARRDPRNCKHCWSVRLAVQAERLEAEQGLDADAPIALELTEAAYELLDALGEPCDVPALCPECGAVGLPTHVDHLCRACLCAELCGPEDPAA